MVDGGFSLPSLSAWSPSSVLLQNQVHASLSPDPGLAWGRPEALMSGFSL